MVHIKKIKINLLLKFLKCLSYFLPVVALFTSFDGKYFNVSLLKPYKLIVVLKNNLQAHAKVDLIKSFKIVCKKPKQIGIYHIDV